jgi:hypothetical protein
MPGGRVLFGRRVHVYQYQLVVGGLKLKRAIRDSAGAVEDPRCQSGPMTVLASVCQSPQPSSPSELSSASTTLCSSACSASAKAVSPVCDPSCRWVRNSARETSVRPVLPVTRHPATSTYRYANNLLRLGIYGQWFVIRESPSPMCSYTSLHDVRSLSGCCLDLGIPTGGTIQTPSSWSIHPTDFAIRHVPEHDS